MITPVGGFRRLTSSSTHYISSCYIAMTVTSAADLLFSVLPKLRKAVNEQKRALVFRPQQLWWKCMGLLTKLFPVRENRIRHNSAGI
jgi:hypothetical protein